MGKSLGIFDSGLGGLTVLKALLQKNQYDRYVYFGDTARVPYGTREEKSIRALAMQDMRFLLSRGVDELVVACNTITAVALDALREEAGVPVHGVIEAAAKAAVKATKNGRIGLLATQATLDNGAYARALAALAPQTQLTALACPRFVELVESGAAADDAAVAVACAEYLAPVGGAGCDTVVLGCTHFPVYESAIAAGLGPAVTLINSGAELAEALPGKSRSDAPELVFFVSGDPAAFDSLRHRFLPQLPCASAQAVDITKY